MFDFLKKPASPFQLAAYIAMKSSEHMDGVEEQLTSALAMARDPKLPKGKTLDELQWVPVACGVIATRMCFGAEAADQVLHQLGVVYARIHETNGRRTPFSEEFIANLQEKIKVYLKCFEGGLGMNAVRLKGSVDPVNVALKRVAALGHDLIRGLPLADVATMELPDEPLPRVVFDLARKSTERFRGHFDSFRLS